LGLPGINLTKFRATIRKENGEEFSTVLHEDNDGCKRPAKIELG
jgi:hypothetical protein